MLHFSWPGVALTAFLTQFAMAAMADNIQPPVPLPPKMPWLPELTMEGEGEDQKYSLPACQDLLTVGKNAFLYSDDNMQSDWARSDTEFLKYVPPAVYQDGKGEVSHITMYDKGTVTGQYTGGAYVSFNQLGKYHYYQVYVLLSGRRLFENFMVSLSDDQRSKLTLDEVLNGVAAEIISSASSSVTILNHEWSYYVAQHYWRDDYIDLYRSDRFRRTKICNVWLFPQNNSPVYERFSLAGKTWSGAGSRYIPYIAAALPNVERFYTLLNEIMGSTHVDGGSMCTWCERRNYNRKAALTWALRPWALQNKDTRSGYYRQHRSYDQTMAFLHLWSMRGPWQRQRYERLQQEIPTAMENFSRYYQSYFGYSDEDAKMLASSAVGDIVLTFFSGATTYDESWPVERRQQHILKYADTPSGQAHIAMCGNEYLSFLLMSDTPWSDVEPFLPSVIVEKLPAETMRQCSKHIRNSGSRDYADFGKQEPLLSYALHRPDDMGRLIERGANLEERNRFGKTTLMFAAHLDNLPAARILLKNGADVNATTLPQRPEDGYELQIQFWSRSALMYAAENASLKMISYLLKAGADATAQDSGGRGMLDYLGRNEGLSEKDKSKAAKMLQQAGAVN